MLLTETMRSIWETMQDLCFPRECIGCRREADRPARHLCWDCRVTAAVLSDPVCRLCGDRPAGRIETAFTCGNCRVESPAYARARSAVNFEGVAREMLHAFKYGAAIWLCADLVDWLEGCVRAHFSDVPLDAITCVPLHARRRRHRTYNQSALLARGLARRMGLPYAEPLERVRPTISQTTLSATARRRNVRGAFAVRASESVVARSWLVVDDVMTTGATLNETARAMTEHGAAWVGAVTVARG